jgi:hypothetical protein
MRSPRGGRSLPDPTAADGELIRLRNRVTELEANGVELQARSEQADAEAGRLTIANRGLNTAAVEALERAEQAEAELKQYRARLAARIADEAGLSWQELLDRAEHLREALGHLADDGDVNDLMRPVVAERDALKATMQHLAAEAHRRKWAHEHSSPAAFEVLHRIGNELLAALDASGGTTEKPKHIGGRANAEDCPACTGDLPYPWICPGNAPESPADASTPASAPTEVHGGAGEAQEGSA